MENDLLVIIQDIGLYIGKKYIHFGLFGATTASETKEIPIHKFQWFLLSKKNSLLLMSLNKVIIILRNYYSVMETAKPAVIVPQ